MGNGEWIGKFSVGRNDHAVLAVSLLHAYDDLGSGMVQHVPRIIRLDGNFPPAAVNQARQFNTAGRP